MAIRAEVYRVTGMAEKPSTSILQGWVMGLGLRHQGVLLTAVRGCDSRAPGSLRDACHARDGDHWLPLPGKGCPHGILQPIHAPLRQVPHDTGEQVHDGRPVEWGSGCGRDGGDMKGIIVTMIAMAFLIFIFFFLPYITGVTVLILSEKVWMARTAAMIVLGAITAAWVADMRRNGD